MSKRSILIEEIGTKRRRLVYTNYRPTEIKGLILTKWHRDYKPGRYAITHENTGRTLNYVPLTMEQAEKVLLELAERPIDWRLIWDWDGIQRLFLPNLNVRLEEMLRHGRYL